VKADTLFPTFSVIKAVTATALHIQVARGLVDYDTPVAVIGRNLWPMEKTRSQFDMCCTTALACGRCPKQSRPRDGLIMTG
jgi:hypothetical protein